MKNLLRTTSAAALLAALVPAQNDDEATKALARAKVVETHEGDLAAAEASYRALLADPARGAAHGEAALRLGSLLWRLDRRDDATPFLQRAAAAGGAIGAEAQRVLQGQGDSDQAAQERMTRARAVVARLVGLVRSRHQSDLPGSDALEKSIDGAAEELQFFGAAGAAAVVEQLRQLRAAAGPDAKLEDPVLPFLAAQLWSLGTEPARSYLAEVASDPSVEWRRTNVAPARLAAEDLLLTTTIFLRDADPTGEVARAAAAVTGRLPSDTLAQLVTDASPVVRAAGWNGLGQAWLRLAPPEQDRLVARLAEPLAGDLSTGEPRSRLAAQQLLATFAAIGPAGARRLVLRHLAHLPVDVSFAKNTFASFVLGDDEMRLLADAGRSLGDCPVLDSRSNGGQRVLADLLNLHQPAWSADAVDPLLDLIGLGYAQLLEGSPRQWTERAADSASDEQVVRLIRLAPRIATPQALLYRLGNRTGRPQFFAAAREAFEEAMSGTPAGWRVVDQPANQESTGVSKPASALIQIAAASGAPGAAEWMGSLVTHDAVFSSSAGWGLVKQSTIADREPVRAELRKLLVDDRAGISRRTRSMVFAELVRLGDVPAIASFGRVLHLGMEDTFSHPIPTAGPAQTLGVLADTGQAWHHYDAEHLATAWREVLGAATPFVIAQLESRKVTLPVAALPAALRNIPSLANSSDRSRRLAVLKELTDPLSNVGSNDVTTNPELRSAIAEALSTADQETAMLTLSRLAPAVVAHFATELRRRIPDAQQSGRVVAALQTAGLPVSDDEWTAALRSSDWRAALPAVPVQASAGVRREVEAMLRDPDADRRAAACAALARWLSKDAVAPLLDALRDPTPRVREAATDALQQIRFHAEQQGFWSKDRNAVDTSPAATAAKLLAQAMPDQGKEQRLLAIRSLATLGAAEALPHLIDWSKDRDADVAAAARQALDAIHTRGSERK